MAIERLAERSHAPRCPKLLCVGQPKSTADVGWTRSKAMKNAGTSLPADAGAYAVGRRGFRRAFLVTSLHEQRSNKGLRALKDGVKTIH
jgi:hypothetical protein